MENHTRPTELMDVFLSIGACHSASVPEGQVWTESISLGEPYSVAMIGEGETLSFALGEHILYGVKYNVLYFTLKPQLVMVSKGLSLCSPMKEQNDESVCKVWHLNLEVLA